MNGNCIPITAKEKNRVFRCSYVKYINIETKENVLTTNSDVKYVFKNPYYCTGSYDNLGIQWQNTGTPKDKNIFISTEHFPNAAPGVRYPFDFLIDGVKKQTIYGTLAKSGDMIHVPIPSIHKEMCENRNCEIKLGFGKKNRVFELPPPMILVHTSGVTTV